MSNYNQSIEESSSKQIKKGAIISYLGIGFNVLAGLLYTPWMISQIGQADFGLYTLAISLISMFLIDFGLGLAVSRFLSMYLAKGNQDKVNKMLGITYKIYLVIDIIILLILIIVFFNIDIIFKELTDVEIEKFKVIYIIAAVFSLISFPMLTLNGILTSYEKFFKLKLYDLLNKVISITLIIIALIMGYGLYALVTANAISGILVILLKLFTIRKETPVQVNFLYYEKKLMREIFSFSAWSAIVGISQRFIFNITPSILGAMSGAKNIAVFGIASSLEGYVFTLANALNSLFLPKVSRLITNKDNSTNNILNLMIKVGRIQIYIVGLIMFGFILLGKDFILLWVGKDFELAYISTVLLIIPAIIYLPQEIGNTTIIAMNKVKMQAFVFILMAITNIVLAFLFSKIWGVIGASLAILLSYSIRNIGLNIIYYKVLKLNVFKFFKESYFKILPQILIMSIISYFSFQLYVDITWIFFLFKGVVYVIFYSITVWLFCFNKFEKELIESLYTSIKNKIIKR